MFFPVLSMIAGILGLLAWGPSPGRHQPSRQAADRGKRASRPDERPVTAVDCVWAAGRKESKLHLVPGGEVGGGAEFLAARCSHRVRGVIGAWSGRPPNIRGYALCESCCVAEKVFLVLSEPAVPLDEALSTALGGHRPGRHAADRLTAMTAQVAAETTDRLPALRVIDVQEWPASDRAGAGAPGGWYLPGAAAGFAGPPGQPCGPRRAPGGRAEAA